MYQTTDPSTSNHTERTRTRLMTIFICLLVFIALVFGFLFLGTRNSKLGSTSPHNTTPSMFSFKSTGDWHQGPTTSTTMALFSPADHSGLSPCVALGEYDTGIVDAKAEQVKNRTAIASSSVTVKTAGTQKMSIHTSEGDKKYNLEQYSVTNSAKDSQPVMGGGELGFVQLEKGYLRISGKCDTVDQLPSITPALKALSFSTHIKQN